MGEKENERDMMTREYHETCIHLQFNIFRGDWDNIFFSLDFSSLDC